MTNDIQQDNAPPSCPLCTGGRKTWLLWLAVLVFIVIFFYTNRSASTPLSYTGIKSIEKELAQASETNRPILVIFHATWCEPCHILARTVLADEQVKQALDNWVQASFDVDEDPKTARAFGVQSLPTLVILSPQGRQLARHEGTLSVKEFLGFLRSAEKQLATATTQPST